MSCFCPKRAVKRKKNCFDKDWADKNAASDKGSYYKQHEEGQDFEEAAINGFSNNMKLLSKGSDDDNEVNKSQEFDGKLKHYFVESFCFTGVSGSCVISSLLLKN